MWLLDVLLCHWIFRIAVLIKSNAVNVSRIPVFFYNPVLFNGEFYSLKSERASACSVMKISVDIDGIQTGEK